MNLYYIRHGQSANNHLWQLTRSRQGRVCDPELTPTGMLQAERVGAYLAGSRSANPPIRDPQNLGGFYITHLYSSLMLRSVQTGTAISRHLGIPLHGWVDWHEEGGIYEEVDDDEKEGRPGKGRGFFQAEFPNFILPDEVKENGWWNRAFEEEEDRVVRGRRALQELIRRHGNSDEGVAIVSHGGFVHYFIGAILGLSARPPMSIRLNNCSITRFDFSDGKSALVYANRVDFLPNELIT
ncbi:MAG TPA: histidine phosphatase family protein [Anaerolineaceae bacterium]